MIIFNFFSSIFDAVFGDWAIREPGVAIAIPFVLIIVVCLISILPDIAQAFRMWKAKAVKAADDALVSPVEKLQKLGRVARRTAKSGAACWAAAIVGLAVQALLPTMAWAAGLLQNPALAKTVTADFIAPAVFIFLVVAIFLLICHKRIVEMFRGKISVRRVCAFVGIACFPIAIGIAAFGPPDPGYQLMSSSIVVSLIVIGVGTAILLITLKVSRGCGC
jgi:hypothetical protein